MKGNMKEITVKREKLQSAKQRRSNRGYYILLAAALLLMSGLWYATARQRAQTTQGVPSERTVVQSTPSYTPPPSEAEVQSIYQPKPSSVPASVPVPELARDDYIFNPIMPATGKITREFSGEELIYNRTMEDWRTHRGLDIEGDIGTQVRACDAGTVQEIIRNEMFGNTVVLVHEDGTISRYSNLQEHILVSNGQKVNRGEVLGGVGTSAAFEIGDPPHLHFEIIVNNEPINPLSLIK